uniref:Reverse transcriptase/retrotransposon-derived protein RNase H-like domain-containing protein n=1 Tax=Strigamia maritima TaxID=126957 RepID=T1IM25_STRMM
MQRSLRFVPYTPILGGGSYIHSPAHRIPVNQKSKVGSPSVTRQSTPQHRNNIFPSLVTGTQFKAPSPLRPEYQQPPPFWQSSGMLGGPSHYFHNGGIPPTPAGNPNLGQQPPFWQQPPPWFNPNHGAGHSKNGQAGNGPTHSAGPIPAKGKGNGYQGTQNQDNRSQSGFSGAPNTGPQYSSQPSAGSNPGMMSAEECIAFTERLMQTFCKAMPQRESRPDKVHHLKSVNIFEFDGNSEKCMRFLEVVENTAIAKAIPLDEMWDTEQEVAFQKVKDALSNENVLLMPDLKKPFVILTDASHVGLGAVLCQDAPVCKKPGHQRAECESYLAWCKKNGKEPRGQKRSTEETDSTLVETAQKKAKSSWITQETLDKTVQSMEARIQSSVQKSMQPTLDQIKKSWRTEQERVNYIQRLITAEDSLQMQVTIGGLTYNALIDSGATQCFIGEHMLTKTGCLPDYIQEAPPNMQVCAVGIEHTPVGQITLCIEWHRQLTPMNFFILPKGVCSLIIGHNFMRRVHLNMHPGEGYFSCTRIPGLIISYVLYSEGFREASLKTIFVYNAELSQDPNWDEKLLTGSNCTAEQRLALKEVLTSVKGVFSDKPGCFDG